MYYIWEHDGGEKARFFSCGVEQFEGWEDIGLNFGKRPEKTLQIPLKYYANNEMPPEDYPRTGSCCWFLLSQKVVNILKDNNIPNIDYYESQIISPKGEIFENYYTINVLNVLHCVDREKSDYLIKDYGFPGSEYFFFNKLVLDKSKIPDKIKLFILGEIGIIRVVHQDIKDACEKAGVTGIKFIPVEEYRDI